MLEDQIIRIHSHLNVKESRVTEHSGVINIFSHHYVKLISRFFFCNIKINKLEFLLNIPLVS